MIVLYHEFQHKKQKEDGENFQRYFNTCNNKYDTLIFTRTFLNKLIIRPFHHFQKNIM